jgi:hypothetical protein
MRRQSHGVLTFQTKSQMELVVDAVDAMVYRQKVILLCRVALGPRPCFIPYLRRPAPIWTRRGSNKKIMPSRKGKGGCNSRWSLYRIIVHMKIVIALTCRPHSYICTRSWSYTC